METVRKFRTVASNEKDLLESLITISKTIYAGRYDIDENSDVEKLASYPNINLSRKGTEQSVELVRKISKKITEEKTIKSLNGSFNLLNFIQLH